MKKIGIFYGSSTGNTEEVAFRLAKMLNVNDSDVHDVAHSAPSDMGKYDLLLLGSSTWGNGDLQDDWYDFIDGAESLDLAGKSIALFGCGDETMSNTFCDAVGILYERMQKTCARFIGKYEGGSYTFDESKAFVGGQFLGLLLDEVNEPEKTENRLEYWVARIKAECEARCPV